MIVLAVLVWIPRWAIACAAFVMIAGHNLLDGVRAEELGEASWVWRILHEPALVPLSDGANLFVLYPLIPWVGVMAAGYSLGPLMQFEPETRQRLWFKLGAAVTLAFVVLRATNFYGDPAPWTIQENWPSTVLSFLNCEKYPPSLLFLMMTLGPAIALLPWLDRARGRIADGLLVLGRVPLFFWLLHVPLIHLVAVGLSLARYGGVIPWLTENPPTPLPDGYGYGLPVVYAVTLAVVLLLLPVCRWFAGVKRRRRDAWLGYL